MTVHQSSVPTGPNAGPGWRFSVLALLVYVLITLVLTGPSLSGSTSLIPEGFLDRDLLSGPPEAERAKLKPAEDPAPVVIELGRERAVAAGLREGRLDTWTPLVGGGAPLWAEQGSPFFPTKVLHYVVPGHAGYMLGLSARLVLAALGLYALAMSLGLPRGVALFSGALLACSGAFVSNLGYVSSSAGFMLPWALYAAQRLAAEQSLRAMGVAAVVLGITAHGNHPSYILFVAAGFGVWLATAVLQRAMQGVGWVRTIPLALGAGALAVLISAAAMLPFLELVAQGFSYKDSEISDFIWQRRLDWTRDSFAVAWLFPSLMTAARDYMGAHLWPWAQGASIGLVALALALAGLPALRRHWALATVLALGVGLTLAPWGLHWLHRLPGLRIVLPWYCYPLIAAPLSVLAGQGLATLLDRNGGPKRLLAASMLMVGMLGALLVLLWPLSATVHKVLAGVLDVDQQVMAAYANALPRKLTLVSPLAIGAAALACWLLRRRPAWAAVAVALLAVGEAVLIRAPLIGFERAQALLRAPTPMVDRLRHLQADGSWRFVGFPPRQIAEPNAALLFGLRDLRSFHALAVKRHVQFLELAGRQADSPWRNPQWQYPTSLHIPILSLASIRYVVLARDCVPTDCRPTGLQLLETADQVALYENPDSLPRFRIAHNVITVPGPEEAAVALRKLIAAIPSGDAPTWRDTIVVEADPTTPTAAAPETRSGQQTGGWVRRVAEPDPQTIALEAQLDRPGYLVVADTWYPGWRATVNGQPVPVVPANLQFRAVALPAGRHQVVISYRPWAVTMGYALSAAGLLAAILFWCWPAMRARTARSAGV